jgi:hypothetical protein
VADIGKRRKRVSVPAPQREPVRKPSGEPMREPRPSREKEKELVPAGKGERAL